MQNIFHISTIPWPLIYLIVLLIFVFIAFAFGYIKGKESDQSSKKLSRSILGGQFSEQMAPFLPNFPDDLKPSEARFIGKPIDFIIFKGMDEQEITEVVFVEVKSGKSHLSTNERKLRDAIEAGKVRWFEYHIPDEVSNMQIKN